MLHKALLSICPGNNLHLFLIQQESNAVLSLNIKGVCEVHIRESGVNTLPDTTKHLYFLALLRKRITTKLQHAHVRHLSRKLNEASVSDV